MPVTLVLDRSGSMTAGSVTESKYAAACVLSGGLAFAALKAGSPVAFALSDAQSPTPAAHSPAVTSAALVALRSFPVSHQAPLSQCLESVLRGAARRQLVMVLSDLHDPCARQPLALLAQRHEVVLVRLLDAMELRTPRGGTLCLVPAEGGPARFARDQRPRPAAVEDAVASLDLPTVHMDPAQPVSRQMASFLTLCRKMR